MPDELVTVYASQGPMQAEVIKGLLESMGIPAILHYQAIGQIYGITVNGVGRVEVQVRPQDQGAAREIIAAEPDFSEFDEQVDEGIKDDGEE